jgi:hypothetical protein
VLGSLKARDSIGVFNLRQAGGTDELVKVTANDTTADYLFQKVVGGGGVSVSELNDGGNEQLEIRTGILAGDTVRDAATPTTPSQLSANQWQEVGSLLWNGSSLQGVPTDYAILWRGYIEPGSADYELRLQLVTDGTVLGTVLAAGNSGLQLVEINIDETLIPAGQDDAFILSHRSASQGSGGRTWAGGLFVEVV